MLQSVHEHSQLLTRDVAAVAPASTGYAIGSLGTLAPWQSPAVLELRQGVGKREGAAPMMIEGRTRDEAKRFSTCENGQEWQLALGLSSAVLFDAESRLRQI